MSVYFMTTGNHWYGWLQTFLWAFLNLKMKGFFFYYIRPVYSQISTQTLFDIFFPPSHRTAHLSLLVSVSVWIFGDDLYKIQPFFSFFSATTEWTWNLLTSFFLLHHWFGKKPKQSSFSQPAFTVAPSLKSPPATSVNLFVSGSSHLH